MYRITTLQILITLHLLRHWLGLLALIFLPRFFDFLNILFLNVFHLQLVEGEGLGEGEGDGDGLGEGEGEGLGEGEGEGLGEGELVSQEPRVEGDHSPSLPH